MKNVVDEVTSPSPIVCVCETSGLVASSTTSVLLICFRIATELNLAISHGNVADGFDGSFGGRMNHAARITQDVIASTQPTASITDSVVGSL